MTVPNAIDSLQWSTTDFAIMADVPVRYFLFKSWALVGDARLGYAQGGRNVMLISADAGFLYQFNNNVAIEGLVGFHLWLGDHNHALIPLKARGTYTPLNNLDVVFDVAFFDSSEFGGGFLQLSVGCVYRYQIEGV